MRPAARELEGGVRRQIGVRDSGPSLNRQLSALTVNEHVLERACDPSLPPIERLEILAMFSSNLDELFVNRVARLKQRLASGMRRRPPDALHPAEVLREISRRAHALTRQSGVLSGDLLRALERDGAHLLRPHVLTPALRNRAAIWFEREVLPVLTPMAIDPGHPFPHLAHKSLNLVVRFALKGRLRFGVVPVPQVLPRLADLDGAASLLLEELIALNVNRLFPQFPIVGCHACRVTRNRDRGNAVRLEIAASADGELVAELCAELGLEAADVYRIEGPLAVAELLQAAARLESRAG